MATHRSSLLIHAPLSTVFAALTQPDLIKQWQFGKTLHTSWEPGSDIRFSTAYNGTTLEQWGKVLEVQENQLIRYSLFTPKPGLTDVPENYCVTSYVLSGSDGNVNVEIIQEDPRPSFEPLNLLPILAGLRSAVEQLSRA